MLKIKTIAIFRKFSTVIIIWIQFVNASILIATDIRLAFRMYVTVIADLFEALTCLNGSTVSLTAATLIIVPLCRGAVWILGAFLVALLGICALVFYTTSWAAFVTGMAIVICWLLTLKANFKIYAIVVGTAGRIYSILILHIKTIVVTFALLLLGNINTAEIHPLFLQLFQQNTLSNAVSTIPIHRS